MNKVRESRFIKCRDRQTNKFNTLASKVNRGNSTQPLGNNNTPLQAPHNSKNGSLTYLAFP